VQEGETDPASRGCWRMRKLQSPLSPQCCDSKPSPCWEVWQVSSSLTQEVRQRAWQVLAYKDGECGPRVEFSMFALGRKYLFTSCAKLVRFSSAQSSPSTKLPSSTMPKPGRSQRKNRKRESLSVIGKCGCQPDRTNIETQCHHLLLTWYWTIHLRLHFSMCNVGMGTMSTLEYCYTPCNNPPWPPLVIPHLYGTKYRLYFSSIICDISMSHNNFTSLFHAHFTDTQTKVQRHVF
jgi:hypothetical protein